MMRRISLSLLACAALVLTGCEDPPENVVQGYIEGDFLFIGAEDTGRIAELSVTQGAHVDAGTVLFRLETANEDALLAAAEARTRAAKATLADLKQGARPQRIELLGAAINRAAAERDLADKERRRAEELFLDGTIAESRRDEALTRLETAEARLLEARKDLELARLPEREDRIQAAEADVLAAEKDAESKRRILERRTVPAPEAGLVHEVLRRKGEMTPAGGAVITFLPDQARRAVFFVGEGLVAGLNRGDTVDIACDGCPNGLTAKINLISEEVQFTPPVIYGTTERKRLLVRIEAGIDPDAAPALKPGLPITVTLPVPHKDGGDGK
ncbi:MAG: HlyD family efflux transporter periplasmic adaptor subunit [Rhodospirillales bacterium]|nr:HlyD family efflux transporter periplasmic adaptor subunit [Rhodospirillales bacterium]